MKDKKRSKYRVGDAAMVRREMFTRGGQVGIVVDVFDDGLALDFFRYGRELPTIEFWNFNELDLHSRTGARDKGKGLIP